MNQDRDKKWGLTETTAIALSHLTYFKSALLLFLLHYLYYFPSYHFPSRSLLLNPLVLYQNIRSWASFRINLGWMLQFYQRLHGYTLIVFYMALMQSVCFDVANMDDEDDG